MVSNRFLGSIGNAIDSAASGTFLAKRASGPVFENLDYADISDYPTGADVDSAAIVNLIDSNFLSTRTPGTSITTVITDSGLNHIVPDSAGEAVKIGNYSKGIANVFADSSTIIKISSHTISLTSNHVLIEGGTAASDFSSGGASSGPAWLGDRAVISGGRTTSSVKLNNIDYYNITSPGNAADFGDLTTERVACSSSSSRSRALVFNGYAASDQNSIDYFAIATLGNASDFGNSGHAYIRTRSASDGTYAFHIGGQGMVASYTFQIGRVTIDTPGNATDFGNLTTAGAASCGSVYGAGYVHVGGGNRRDGYGNGDEYSNAIDYFAPASATNATDFGDLTVARKEEDACGDETRGVWVGGYPSGSSGGTNVMDYITLGTTGNATDFGDLTGTRKVHACTSNSTYGTSNAGLSGSALQDGIDYFTIQTPGNASNFGNLTQDNNYLAACSGSPS